MDGRVEVVAVGTQAIGAGSAGRAVPVAIQVETAVVAIENPVQVGVLVRNPAATDARFQFLRIVGTKIGRL